MANTDPQKTYAQELKKQQQAAMAQNTAPIPQTQGAAQQQRANTDTQGEQTDKDYKKQLNTARQKMQGNVLEDETETTKDASTSLGTKFTSGALKMAWLNIIDTFGLTLIYINFHFLGKYFVGSKYFSEFGEEWKPPLPSGDEQPGGEVIAKGLGAAKWAELILLFILDIILLLIIALALLVFFTPFWITIGFFNTVPEIISNVIS